MMKETGAAKVSVPHDEATAFRWLLAGRVQGVGFRPFAFRLAQASGICGYVQNQTGRVVIVGEGQAQTLARFGRDLVDKAPPLACPVLVSCSVQQPAGWAGFHILASGTAAESDVHLPPDCFCCDACLKELNDPRDRRFGYPFINCTQCGPRYTLIRRLPYDRINTSMSGFPLCARCLAEYEDPGNRRFHAEPVACPECGPQLAFQAPGLPKVLDDEAALQAGLARLAAGGIVAVKGIGGYHLLADATNDDAVARLRTRKQRPHKPLAVMFPGDGDWLDRTVLLDAVSRNALFDPVRPVVLARLRAHACLSGGIAPGLNEVGAMLPYSPLHHLLLRGFGKPLVATSANLSGEPVLTDGLEVERRLGVVADCFLHHNRDIVRPADDSVVRVIAGKTRAIRLGRGAAPVELKLPFTLTHPMLAVGSQMKNTIALAWGDRAVVSPHIGDLESPRALDVFQQTVADLQALYDVTPASVACDAHPGFSATRWALASGFQVIRVQHHRAHASALAAEYPEVETWLMFTWDGVGLGDDGTLWGGEGFLGRPGQWRRAGSLRPFSPPGAEKAAREPWRSAAGLCWEAGHAWRRERYALAYQAWTRRLNCLRTSAAGRVFDAAAAMTGLVDDASYEGQGPMWLEAAAHDGQADPIPLPLVRRAGGVWELDWAPLIPVLSDGAVPVRFRAAAFHASLGHGLLAQAQAVRRESGVNHVGLCGGVFQNRLLAELAVSLLQESGFKAFLPERLPCNDGALSFGQLVEAGARQ